MVLTTPRRRAADYNLLETAGALGRFSRFLGLIHGTGLTALLSGSEQMTVFAPSDYALERLAASGEGLDALLRDPLRAEQLLAGHLVAGRYREADLIPFTRLPSLTGAALHLTLAEGDILVSGIQVLTPDILATNGVIHELDGVLLPD